MSNVTKLPVSALRNADCRRVVHELPANAALPGALVFQFFGDRIMQSVTEERTDEQATCTAATGTDGDL